MTYYYTAPIWFSLPISILKKHGARSTRKIEILQEKNIQILQTFYTFYYYYLRIFAFCVSEK